MTQVDPPAPPSSLAAELRWLIRARWVASGTVILATLVSAGWLDWSPAHARVLVVAGIALAYNLLFWAVLRRDGVDERAAVLSRAAWLQLGLDLVCLTLITMWTGGVRSPLLSLFVLHLVFASLLLPRLSGYLLAAMAMAMVLGGLRLSDQWPAGRVEGALALGWVLLLLLTAMVAGHVTAGLRDRERHLRRQHRRTEAILRTAAEGIITIDEHGIIESVNPATERIFGYDRAALIGRNVNLLMHDEQRDDHDGYIERYLRTGEARIIGIGREVRGRRRDGETVMLDLAVSQVRLGDRRIFTGIVRDITERKRAEQDLARLNEELTRQQQALVQREKMSAMGQMAAGIAHEIANPLASMDSLLQLAKRRPDHLTEGTVDTLREQVDRIDRIVRQMTEFAHPNETGWETRPLNDVIEGALEIIRFDHRLREIEVCRELAPDTGPVRLIPHAIQQVVVNLVMNAVDALAGTETPRLVVATSRHDGWAVVEITDNGSGIAAENLEHVFEPFFTTKPVGQGTGLGLSISYSLIERHGGRCEVESAPGERTRFTVLLPAARSGGRETTAAAAS